MGALGDAVPRYGTFLFVAVFCAARVFGSELVRKRLGTWRDVTLLCWIGVPVAFAGAKLGGILDARELFLEDPLAYMANPTEHAFLGALAGGLALFWPWFRRRGASIGGALDALAPAIPVGYAVGRVGCYVHGCCRGIESSLPWARRYAGSELAVHPTQLYEAGAALGLYVLLWSWRERFRRPGTLFLVGLACSAGTRFGVEWLRTNPRHVGLSQAQWICLVVLIACVLARRRSASAVPDRPPRPREDRSARGA